MTSLPLTQFLFLLVVQGLGMFVKKAEVFGLYTSFTMGASCFYVSYLQYVDDTLFIGEASMENLKEIKRILAALH